MAGQYVTDVDPAPGGGANPSLCVSPPPPFYTAQGLPGPSTVPPYPDPSAPQDQGGPPASPVYIEVVADTQEDNQSGLPSPPQRASNGQQQQRPSHAISAIPGLNGNKDEAGSRRAATKGGANVAAVEKENRRQNWAMFVLGNLISVAVVVSEISQLSVCFEENLGDDDDLPEENAAHAYGWMMLTLVLGLWVDVFSAVTLSVIYVSPLDIKSAHKIPAQDMRHCGGTIMINFLTPFSWALICLSGGLVSELYEENAPCGGRAGGSALEIYLYASGVLMFLFSSGMMILSGVMLLLACTTCPQKRAAQNASFLGRGATRPAGCLTRIRETLYTKVLSKSPIYDLVWQLQGVILSYRAGAFGLFTAALVGGEGIFGEVLAAFGRLAPVVVEELLGPAMV